MTDTQTQLVLEKISELSRQNLTINEADSMLTNTLLAVMSDEIKDAYGKMVSDMIPF